jgi:hypothetical protein
MAEELNLNDLWNKIEAGDIILNPAHTAPGIELRQIRWNTAADESPINPAALNTFGTIKLNDDGTKTLVSLAKLLQDLQAGGSIGEVIANGNIELNTAFAYVEDNVADQKEFAELRRKIANCCGEGKLPKEFILDIIKSFVAKEHDFVSMVSKVKADGVLTSFIPERALYGTDPVIALNGLLVNEGISWLSDTRGSIYGVSFDVAPQDGSEVRFLYHQVKDARKTYSIVSDLADKIDAIKLAASDKQVSYSSDIDGEITEVDVKMQEVKDKIETAKGDLQVAKAAYEEARKGFNESKNVADAKTYLSDAKSALKDTEGIFLDLIRAEGDLTALEAQKDALQSAKSKSVSTLEVFNNDAENERAHLLTLKDEANAILVARDEDEDVPA